MTPNLAKLRELNPELAVRKAENQLELGQSNFKGPKA